MRTIVAMLTLPLIVLGAIVLLNWLIEPTKPKCPAGSKATVVFSDWLCAPEAT